MRLDKFLANKDFCTRKEARKFLKQNPIHVNGVPVKNVTEKLQENDELTIGEYTFYVNEFKYFLFNKPQGVVCANADDLHQTIFDLMAFEDFQSDLFTVGRLDLDTTGLLLITNDGKFAHSLMSPKRHVDKTYHVVCRDSISDEDLKRLEEGVTIEYDYETMPAKTKRINENEIYLTISEGKFHQVKRMLVAVDNEVTELSRVSIGNLTVPEDLPVGEYEAYTKKTLEELIY
ncbi:pseudouridine synthase [Mollicutes bacterium LVI A0039]|nr:pseudouridine synthase [Mollicutes bacterium LVI A0039]